MPGICGVVAEELDAKARLHAIRRVHAMQGLDFAEETHERDHCFFVSFGPTAHPPQKIGRLPGTDAFLVLEGEVFNADQFRSAMAGERYSTTASALLEAYLDRGTSFVELLDGEFNIAVYEPACKRLMIFSDHVGSWPLYFSLLSCGFMFGSEKKFILANWKGPRNIDPVGLLQPFVHRHNLDDRTFVDSIKRLKPASWLRYEAGRLTTGHYGAHLGGDPVPERASELIDSWNGHLIDATSKRLRNKSRLGVSLSGGLDSRAIACSIDRNLRPIWSRTMGESSSPEVTCASAIARALGFDHSVEDISQYKLSSAVHRIVWRTEGENQFRDGLSTLTHAQTRLSCDHLIGGWLGDVSSGAHIRPFMLLPMNRRKLIGKIYDWYVSYAHADYRSVFNPDFLAKNLPAVREAFFDSYARYMDLPGSRMHEMWDLRNRQTRMTISSMPVDSHIFGKVRPFFDRRYLDFVMSIPLRWRIAQNLYKSLIFAIGPEIRSVPNGNNNLALKASPLANLSAFAGAKGLNLAGRLVARASGGAAGKSGADVLGFSHQTRVDSGLRRIIEDFVSSTSFDDGIFSRPGVELILDQHYRGARDHSNLVGILATWSVALKYFVYDETLSCPEPAQPVV